MKRGDLVKSTTLAVSLLLLANFCFMEAGVKLKNNAVDVSLGKKRPNIIFIMADDLGYGDLSCFGSQTINTPHLDELCSKGIKFTDFHSNGPVCSPTRAALLTGRYQQRSNVAGVILVTNRDHGMDLDETTFAEILKGAGYKVGMFGKWHLGYKPIYNPVNRGFDEFIGYVSGNVDYQSHVDQAFYFDWWQGNTLQDQPGYVTHLITNNCLDFIERHKDEPFCLYVPHEVPHSPLQTPDDPYFRTARDEAGSGGGTVPGAYNPTSQKYIEMIEIMDEGIGQIVDKICGLGLEENTLIFFCSDNGPISNYGASAGELHGYKGSLWEGGHRVPAIAYWPGKIKPGTVCDETILTIDMLPTFATIAQAGLPGSLTLDGTDISPVLFENAKLPSRTLYWQYGNSQAVRQGKWKWIKNAANVPASEGMLFNLETDLSEQNDLSGQYPEVAQRLETLYNTWYADVTENTE